VSINVRIVQLGRGVAYFQGPRGSTVEAALASVGIDAVGMDVRVDGRQAKADQPLMDGSLVTIVPPIKGGGVGKFLTGR
jgi:sulfur carrier protein ThiS